MKKKCIPILLTILLVLCAFPDAAFAADITITSSGTYDLSMLSFTSGDRLVIGDAGNTLDITLTGDPGTTYNGLGIFCTSSVNLTLQNVKINNSSFSALSLIFAIGSNKLTITGDCSHTAGSFAPGIYVAPNASLNIYGDGTLNVAGGDGYSGIGSSEGSITINSGTINATGGEGAAGIGAIYSMPGSFGVITIKGGTVTANGGGGAAGIGNGMGNEGTGEVHISGGDVTATGGTESMDHMGGAGIGGGTSSANVSVEITGGIVKAYGGNRAAGIGGGQLGSGGTITISGGTVYATGSEGGAGIGGGMNNGMDNAGGAGSITISGGRVYADGQEGTDDIGNGIDAVTGGTLTISGSAAVFAANDIFLSPVSTTTHTHTSYTTDTESSYGISIPSAWVPTFGSYLRPCKLSYSAGNGGGTVPAEVTQLYQTTTATADGSGLSRPYYKFSGWNTKADGTGTAYAAGSTFTFSADTTLYAQWIAQPELKSSVADGKIYTSGRIILTPNIPGGTWSFDSSMLSRDGYTFTGLKSGTTTVTYTVDGVSVSYTVIVNVSDLPATGQDGTLIWVLAAAAAAALAAAVAVKHKRKATL